MTTTQTPPRVRAGDDECLNPDEVLIGTANGPGLWLAPPGTPAPANFGDYDDPWRCLGYASDDGVTIGGDRTTETITPWQSKLPIRTITTEITKTIQFVLWQLNADTLGLYFDTEIEDTGDTLSFDIASDAPPRTYAVSVDVRDGDNRFRVTYSRANLDATGDMAITKSTVVPLDVTLSALDDAGVMVHVDVAVNQEPAPPAGLVGSPSGTETVTGLV